MILALGLVGCDRNTTTPAVQDPSTKALQLTEGLEDCKIFQFQQWSGGSTITIVRCPNSTVSTTYPEGKTTATVITIDGVKYTATPTN